MKIPANSFRIISKTVPLHTLSPAQQRAFYEILTSFQTKNVCLLHGVTASGKTEIYIHLIEEVLKAGKQVLYLLPEIALTTQITERLRRVFGKRLGVYHSKFPDAERVEIWQKQLTEQGYDVILGVRSSVFLPFRRLGLVIVDEEHETSYKQQDPAPRYHARNAAIMLASMYGAKTLLGTATPSLESYYHARNGKYGLVELTERHQQIQLPHIELVDIKELARKKRMTAQFSPLLLQKIREALEQKEQVILFQNRRGFAPMIECRTCGWVPRCKNCDVSLTYHKGLHQLTCHYCGYTEVFTGKCKSCGSKFIYSTGTGTQRIEDEISTLFPSARVLRMDADTTMSKFSYEKNFDKFKNGEYDIMVGTQMIAKGLDFENVTLVGVLLIDKSLYAGDYLGYEKTFSLITQVVGRCGRGSKKGRAYLQTFSPEHYVLNLAADQNYDEFFRQECEIRKALLFPPYCDICEIGLSSVDESACKKGSDSFVKLFMKNLEGHGIPIRVLGPSACSVAKVNGKYRYRIIIKCRNNKEFRSVMKATLLDAYKSPALDKVSFFADMNGEII